MRWSHADRSYGVGSALCLWLSVAAAGQATKEDSGWVSLFNGTDFRGLYTYFSGPGYTPGSVDSQKLFKAENGMIHVVSPASNGYLGTIRQYSWYRVRVEFMWPAGTSLSANAGLLVHLDSAAVVNRTVTSANRPRSIEVNMRRQENSPWTLWSAMGLGPYFTTTVRPGSPNSFQPGGTPWTNDPWDGYLRTLFSSLPNPELPVGQWNRGEAQVFGDSGVFILNGQVRTRAWNFQVRTNPSSPTPRIACSRGNIGLQSEGAEIWYRNFEIMELDSATGKPLRGRWGCTNRSASNFNPSARVDDGSCLGPTALARSGAGIFGREMLVSNTGGVVPFRIPAGYSGAEIFNLQGERIWVGPRKGDGTETAMTAQRGMLRIRFAR